MGQKDVGWGKGRVSAKYRRKADLSSWQSRHGHDNMGGLENEFTTTVNLRYNGP